MRRYQPVGKLISCTQSDSACRYQTLCVAEGLNNLKNTGKNQKDADAAKATDDLGLEIVTRSRELIEAAELHEGREYGHQQQQNQHDLINPAEHFFVSLSIW